MTILNELKALAAKITGADVNEIDERTIAKAIRWLTEHYPDASDGEFAETDPTVPAWAKQTNKPTYTAAEVGALPADTAIPSGAQLLTGEQAAAIPTLEDDAELAAVVQTVNTALAALQARGVIG